jgi:hypothetical protein
MCSSAAWNSPRVMVRSPTRARTCPACSGVSAPLATPPASAADERLLHPATPIDASPSASASPPAARIRLLRRIGPDYYDAARGATAW